MATNNLRGFVLGIIIFSFFNCSDSSESTELTEPVDEDNNPIEVPVEVPVESSIAFQKQYETDSIFTLNSAVQLIDSSYTIAGAVRYNGSGNKNVIMKFDKYGNRDWIKVMENTYTPNGIEKLFKNGNGYIGYRGHHFNIQNSSHVIFFNETGDVESEIFMNNDILGNDMIIDGNNFLIAGYKDGEKTFRMLNQTGNLIWEKSYDLPSAYSISKLTDGNYISIGGANYGFNENSLLKFNENGEEIWNKNYRGFNVLAISNNEFLALTYDDNDSENLVRFNESGDAIWTTQLPNFRTEVNKPSPMNIINYDMEYFVCTYLDINLNLKIIVINQNGNIINTRTINRLTREFKLVTKTIDNGMLIVYSGYSSFSSIFGLIKLSNDFLFN